MTSGSHGPDHVDEETGGDPSAEGTPVADDRRGRAELLDAAQRLTEADEAGPRARSASVRRRHRVVRGREPEPLLGDASEPERVRVRSEAQEGPGAATEGAPAGPDDQPVVGEADDRPRGGEAPRGTGRPGHEPDPPADRGQVVDAAVFLADAVRSYLAGVDEHGVEHPVTDDRLERLRRTLALWDHEEPTAR